MEKNSFDSFESRLSRIKKCLDDATPRFFLDPDGSDYEYLGLQIKLLHELTHFVLREYVTLEERD